jgi:hypothetical protein
MNDFNNLSPEDAEYVLNLFYHLARASLGDDLCELLNEFEFINSKVISNKTQALIEDYSLSDNRKDLFLEIDY